MLPAILFAAALVGVFCPKLVVKQKAFGLSVVLVVAQFVATGTSAYTGWVIHTLAPYSVSVNGPPWSSRIAPFITAVTAQSLMVAAAISLLVAYWPGGTLFRVRRRPEELAPE